MLERYLKEKIALIDTGLSEILSAANEPELIYEAMRYSAFAGGKRLRPLMLMASADAVGAAGGKFVNVACGLEMIHTYSLIHDDLPAMDNDDYRRGKPTNHKVYGEATAILAGDGLLTLAFESMLAQPGIDATVIREVVREIAHSAGPSGMVGGQIIDMLSEGTKVEVATLENMHRLKTGALFNASVRAGAMLGGATTEQLDTLTRYASQFGLAFQITDDILDVIGDEKSIGKPVGSDEKNHKSTYVSAFGLEKARCMAEQAVYDALDALNALKEFDHSAEILRELVKKLLTRTS